MALKYGLVQRGNPRDPNAPKKYYAVNKNTGDVGIRELSAIIAEISTVSEIDTAAVIEAMIIKVPELIADGKIVRLGDFGSFYVTLKSEGADSESAFSPNMIKKLFLRFRPGKLIKNALKSASFEKA